MWGVELSSKGYEVLLMEGPGQGGALRLHGLTMNPSWENPVARVLDQLNVQACSIIGFSLGGYLALRAAAFEPRITRVVLINVLQDFLGCFLDRLPPAAVDLVRWALDAGDRQTINEFAAEFAKDAGIAWTLEHGRFVSGTADAYEFFAWAA